MSDYTNCMKPWMKGAKEIDGVKAMCVGAKMCTGKARSQDEAIAICKSQPAAAPRSGRAVKGAKCMANLDQYVECFMSKINFEADDMEEEIKKAISSCICGTKVTKISKKNKAEEVLNSMPPGAIEALGALKGMWEPKVKSGAG